MILDVFIACIGSIMKRADLKGGIDDINSISIGKVLTNPVILPRIIKLVQNGADIGTLY